MTYITHKRFKNKAICGSVNLPFGTIVTERNGFLCTLDGRKLCAATSENAHQYFAVNDDGKGVLRGQLTQAIQKALAKRDADHQRRWDAVWEDAICQPYRRAEHADHWLWNHAFYHAEIDALRHIAELVGAKV